MVVPWPDRTALSATALTLSSLRSDIPLPQVGEGQTNQVRPAASAQDNTNHQEDTVVRSWTLAVLLLALCVTLMWGPAEAQWRGSERDGIYTGESLLDVWPETGPQLLWSTDVIGAGFSSAAVTADRVYATGAVEGKGYLFAFDIDGKQTWTSAYGPEWSDSYPGARTTPVVAGNRIYLMSAMGSVVCFGTDGKKAWSVDAAQAFGAKQLRWGMTESLLIDGDTVFCTPGGSEATVVALDRHTGKVLWQSKPNGESSTYCSPRLITHNGRRLLVTMTARSVIGLDPGAGEILWSHDHVTKYDINPNTPVYHDGELYTVSGYGTGGQKFKLNADGTGVEQVWAQPILDSQMGSVVLVDGYLYGSGQKNRGWHCVNWETGEVAHTAKVLGSKGNIIYADGMAYCYGEKGDVGLVKPTSGAFEVVSSFKVDKGSGQHWAHPVIRDGRLYVRHGEALMYDISAE